MNWLHAFVDVPAGVADAEKPRLTACGVMSDVTDPARAGYPMRSPAGPAFGTTSGIPVKEAA